MQQSDPATPGSPSSPSIPAAPPAKPRTTLKIVTALGLICVFLLVLIGAGYYRTEYGNFLPWNPPERFNYCGFRYYQESETTPESGLVVTKAQALSSAGAKQLDFAFQIGAIYTWPVYETPGFQCSVSPDSMVFQTLYVQIGPDRYLVMTDAF